MKIEVQATSQRLGKKGLSYEDFWILVGQSSGYGHDPVRAQ
jgi:hypothetical protein